jgi:ClpX C4-type zinc finger protein
MADDAIQPCPPIVASDRVLEYTILNDSVGFNADQRPIFVGREALGKVPCLAICQDRNSASLMLNYCDGEWFPMAVSVHESVVDAKSRAERIYPGSSKGWIEARFTDAEVAAYREKLSDVFRCSFCGKTHDEGGVAIFTGNGDVRICGRCVVEFHNALNEPSSQE